MKYEIKERVQVTEMREITKAVFPSQVYSFMGREKVMNYLVGYNVLDFRLPFDGERYLSRNHNGVVKHGSSLEQSLGGFGGGPRFIVVPKESVWE